MPEIEQHYRDLVESSLDLICTHTLDGVLLTVNLAAARSLGYESAALVHRNLCEAAPGAVRIQLKAGHGSVAATLKSSYLRDYGCPAAPLQEALPDALGGK